MASEVLKKEGIMIAKVDASKEAELAKEHMIQGFPTLSVFKKGVKFEDFSGERTADAIIAYMRKLNDPNWAPPPSAVVTLTADNFTKFVKNEKLSLAMWYAPWCKHCKQVMPGKTMHCTIALYTITYLLIRSNLVIFSELFRLVPTGMLEGLKIWEVE